MNDIIFTGVEPESRPYTKQKEILTKAFSHRSPAFEIEVNIPEGFIWDGASIPRIFWISTGSPFMPEYRTASLVHDYLYTHKTVTRKVADKIFKEILKAHGVGRYTRNKMYIGVRLGGWLRY